MVKLPALPTARFERLAEVNTGVDDTLLVTDSFIGCRFAPARSPEHAAIAPTTTTPANGFIFCRKRTVIIPPLRGTVGATGTANRSGKNASSPHTRRSPTNERNAKTSERHF